MSKDNTVNQVALIQAAVEAGDDSQAEALVISLLGETVVYGFVAGHRWPAKCGTVSGYTRHIQDGTTSCQPCRDANTKRDKQSRAKAKEKATRRRRAVAYLGRLVEDAEWDGESDPTLGGKIHWSNQNLPSTEAWSTSKTFEVAVSETRNVQVMPDTLAIVRAIYNGSAAISDYHKVRASTFVEVDSEPVPDEDAFGVVV